ncbi:MAG: hypothetical protein KJ964_02950 [Verrucomicrobia bacterium]|nr:hypothetical protein [Verrucomicrobiota bacterium]MBU1734167.1 hypothetical protein [Verrucomicrobiota bacterium]MBU1856503.1 hypothetical protein [Verrucomicrobiota bacterium]
MVRHVYRVLCCLVLCIGMELAGSSALAKARLNQETTLVIVPARPRMVQLAFDLADMRPVVVLSCRGDARAANPLLFVWTNGAWQYVSPDDFRERRFVSEWPRQIIMIGDDHALPALLEDEAAWGADVTRLKTLSLADLINGMDPVFHFTDREWKWLARRYDLNLTDINAPRREFNPYDIPRSKLPLETKDFKQKKGDVPPAVLIESPAEVSAPAERAAVQPAPVTLPKAKEPSLK